MKGSVEFDGTMYALSREDLGFIFCGPQPAESPERKDRSAGAATGGGLSGSIREASAKSEVARSTFVPQITAEVARITPFQALLSPSNLLKTL
jgi:hypothetical protein